MLLMLPNFLKNNIKSGCIILLILFKIFIFQDKAYSNEHSDTMIINSNLDSIYHYIYSNRHIADSICDVTIELSKDYQYNKGFYWSNYFKSMIQYINFKNYGKALTLIENNKNTLQKKDSLNLGLSLYHLFNGIVDYRMDNPEKSKRSLLQSIYISNKIKDNRSLAYAYTYISFVYSCLNIPDSSIYSALKADSLIQFLPYDIDKYISLNNLGVAYLSADSLNKSEFYYKKALKEFIRLNDNYGINNVKSNMGLIYIKNKNYKLAKKVLMESYKMAKKYKFNEIEYRSGYRLYILYSQIKEEEKACHFFKISSQSKDSILSITQLNKVNALRESYELQLKEKENIELKRINSIHILKLKNKRIIQWSGTFILILTIFLAIIIYNRYLKIKRFSDKIRQQEQEILKKEKEKIEQKLEYKKRELTIKTLKMFHANKLIDDLSGKLAILRSKIRTRGKVGDELRDDIQSMLNEIRLSANNKIWKEVEYSFNEANPDFLKWLTINFPDLTSNEIKLCIFSMLHLKIKDISMIWMKSSSSIQVARSRLRKKLNISDPNISLSIFLNKKYKEYS